MDKISKTREEKFKYSQQFETMTKIPQYTYTICTYTNKCTTAMAYCLGRGTR